MRACPKHLLWLLLLASPLVVFPPPASAQTTAAKPLITQPVNESNLTVLKGNTYPLARPEFDRGPAPASLPMDRMILVLKRSPEQAAALATLLDQQQEKPSPNYHQWLTPAQFGQQFGLSGQDIETIVAWLQSHGFQIDTIASGRGVIEFSGTAGQVQQTFHTAIHKYVVEGKEHWANATDPQIPTALASAVAGIASLNNFPRKPMHVRAGIFTRSRQTGKVTPLQPMYDFTCSTTPTGTKITCYALGPYDFATIYNVLPLWNAGIDGSGQTIAIVAQTDIDPQDVNDFRSLFGLPAANFQIIHNGPDPGILTGTADETESAADVEWAGAVAKSATIDLVVSQSTESSAGVDLSAQYIVDNDLAPVLSESYGACELDLGTAGNQFYSQLWQQAAAEGITVLTATGDGGSALCDQNSKGATQGLSVDGVASTPYSVAVGGTDFNDASSPLIYWYSTNDSTTHASAKGYIPEIPWNDTCTNPELAKIAGGSTDAETNCNNHTLTAQFPFLLTVVGGSGGVSACTTSSGTLATCSGGYPKPSWQTGNGVPSDGKRDLPDVSVFAGTGFNGNFYIVCQADVAGPCTLTANTFLGVGGTSVSAQAFAGIMALVNQAAQARQGNANYVLYPLAAKTGANCDSSGTITSSCIFYDTTFGTNAMPCVTGSLNCVTNTPGDAYGVLPGYATTNGYDPATGLGTVNVANLVSNWSSVTFTPSSTTLTLNGGNAVNVTHATPVTLDISVSPTSPVPTGDASLIATQGSDSIDAGTFTLSNGSFSGSTTLLPGGTSYTVKAHYAGDGTYAASDSNSVTVTVTPEASQTFANLLTFDTNGNLTSYSASSATYGSGFYLFRVDVGDSSASYSASTGISSTCSNHTASCPTGSVSLAENGAPFAGGSLPLSSQGYAENQSQSLFTPGTYAITASYPGDASYGPSTGTANFTIAKAPTSMGMTLAPIPPPYGYGEAITVEVATNSDGAVPTGTVSFSLDGSPLAVSNLTYQGFPYQPPSGYTSLWAHATATFLTLGSHTFTAQYSGDANYAPSNSLQNSFTVTQAQPSFQPLTTNPASASLNQQVTLTALLYGSAFGAAPTGTISFSDGGTPLSGNITYTSGGPTASQDSYLQASILWTPATSGSHTITVNYAGDTYYLPATSSTAINVGVLPPDFALATSPNPASISISKPGNSGTATLTVATLNGFTGAVSFSLLCPSGVQITCSISPASVTLSGTTTTASATLTVNTTAPSFLPPAGNPTGPALPSTATELALISIFCLALLLLWMRKPERRWGTALAFLLLVSVLAWASCGGSGGGTPTPTNPGTPAGSYTVGVTATSGTLSHTVNVPVIVP